MIKVYIQAEAGSCNKNLYNEKTLEYKGVRQVAQPYPYPYGFVLGTDAPDGDNLDCYIITHDALKTGSIVECDPFGLLEQYENGEVDHKILATLPAQDTTANQGLLLELQEFIYAVFAQFPDMTVRVGQILPRQAVLEHIQASRKA